MGYTCTLLGTSVFGEYPCGTIKSTSNL